MKFIIAGLGNIGPEYAGTRHNVGFDIADELVREAETTYEMDRYAFRSVIRWKGRQLIVLKPTTYMNLSGKAVRYWMAKENVDIQHLLVLVDDMALPFGTIRLKGKGSDGGHNGLRDIQDEIGTTKYARLRFGIGDDFGRGGQVNYVLGRWDGREEEQLPGRIKTAADVVRSFCSIGLERTMNQYNNK